MNINRHNYEEFFILYLDNELSQEERSHVELFLQAHPDLAEELAMLQRAKLVPDNELVYAGKETLMINSGHSFITLNNYEEWLLLYTDNELSAEERTAVEKFISLNPAIKQELEVLQKTILQPEKIVYFNKESLYRKEETKRRVVPIRWQRLAAAAILLFALGTSIFYITSHKASGDKSLAGTTGKEPKINKAVPDPDSSLTRNNQKTESIDPNHTGNPAVGIQTKESTTDLVKTTTIKENKVRVPNKEIVKEEPVTAVNNSNPNNLPEPKYNRNINGNIEQQPIAFVDPASTKALTNQQENKPYIDVTPPTSVSFNDRTTEVANDQPEKRSKLRGLLRKVTRTFEKTTNIKATDENDRLLVAGLAIQL